MTAPSNAPVSVLGGGGHAKVVVAALQAAGHTVEAIFDDDPAQAGRDVLGVTVAGPIEAFARVPGPAVLGIGSNAVRKRLAERFPDVPWISLVHPRAWVHESAVLGAGSVVMAGAVVQPDTVIGPHAIINTGATVDHECELGAYVHVAPGCHLAGNVCAGEGAFLGIGSACIPGVNVGAWAQIGAGAVVIRDVPPYATAVGVPARHRPATP